MLAQKYDRHMFQGTTYRDLGDWYLDHETGRDQIDLSGVKADKREVRDARAGGGSWRIVGRS